MTTDTPLTTRTRIALAIARGVAAAHGHDDLSAAHVALGLLREGENPAVAALHHAGVPLRALRRELERELEQQGRSPKGPRDVAIPLTHGEEKLLARASAEARLRNDKYVGSEHLLLAILREAGGPTAQMFVRRGFDFESAVAHLKLVFPPPEPK